jgi:hypothetical protein
VAVSFSDQARAAFNSLVLGWRTPCSRFHRGRIAYAQNDPRWTLLIPVMVFDHSIPQRAATIEEQADQEAGPFSVIEIPAL